MNRLKSEYSARIGFKKRSDNFEIQTIQGTEKWKKHVNQVFLLKISHNMQKFFHIVKKIMLLFMIAERRRVGDAINLTFPSSLFDPNKIAFDSNKIAFEPNIIGMDLDIIVFDLKKMSSF